jgi:hypothetical protein
VTCRETGKALQACTYVAKQNVSDLRP